MAKFVSRKSKQGFLSVLWDELSSLDTFTKMFIVTAILVIGIVPYFVSNYQTINQHAACIPPDQTHGCGTGEIVCGGCCVVGSVCPAPTTPPTATTAPKPTSSNPIPTVTPAPPPVSSTCTTNGGTCYKYSCPSGYVSLSGTCGTMTDSACCAATVTSAPTNLSSAYSACTVTTSTFTASIYLSWGSVSRATGYNVYYYDYNTSTGEKVSSWSKKVTGTSTNITGISIGRGLRFFWYVKGYNAYSTGPASATKEIVFSCNRL